VEHHVPGRGLGDALPQAMEIIEASLSAQDDHIVDIKIDRVPAGG
jgi:hypothetical protein